MTSNLIYDRTKIWEFIQTVLESLTDFQTYLILGIARKKYEPTLVKSSQIVLARDIIKTHETEVIEKIVRMGNALRENYFKNEPVPDHAKAMYICTNPSDTFKAYHEFSKKINQYYYDFIKQRTLDKTSMKSLDRVWFGCLQASATKGRYLIIDVDDLNMKHLQFVIKDIKDEWIRWITRTRGGYHVFVERNDKTAKLIYMNIQKIANVEITRHGLTPICGTFQGGQKVHRVELKTVRNYSD
jgi:hypothetical protein